MKNNNIDIEKLRNYINDLEEQVTPLTKSKSKKVDQTVDEVAKTESADLIEDSPVPSKKKITRTVTEKKKEQLVKAREVKKENMEKRNKLKKLESAKLLLSEELSQGLATGSALASKPTKQIQKQALSESSSSKSEISFADSMKGLFDTDEVMLKIDIEGGEYELSESLIECLKKNSKKINCVVMEFHDTRARRTEFEHLVHGISSVVPIVHIHGNNCVVVAPDGLPEVVEITFAKDCKNSYSDNLSFPLAGLDFPNDKSLPDLSFYF